MRFLRIWVKSQTLNEVKKQLDALTEEMKVPFVTAMQKK